MWPGMRNTPCASPALLLPPNLEAGVALAKVPSMISSVMLLYAALTSRLYVLPAASSYSKVLLFVPFPKLYGDALV